MCTLYLCLIFFAVIVFNYHHQGGGVIFMTICLFVHLSVYLFDSRIMQILMVGSS